MKSFKIFKICEICPADHLKAEKKKGVAKALSSFLFLSTGTRKGKILLNGSANLRTFNRLKCDKSFSKDPHFLCRKSLGNGIELRQDLYLSNLIMLSNSVTILVE